MQHFFHTHCTHRNRTHSHPLYADRTHSYPPDAEMALRLSVGRTSHAHTHSIPTHADATGTPPARTLCTSRWWVAASTMMLVLWLNNLNTLEGGSHEPGPAVPATTVRFADTVTTLADACGELTRQTGAKFSLVRTDTSARLHLPAQALPFWEAVDTLAAAAKTRVVVGAEAISLISAQADGLSVPVSVSGAFRVSVRQTLTRRDFDTQTHSLEVTLEIACEPKFRPILASTNANLQTISTEPAHPLEITKAPRALVPTDTGVFTARVVLPGLPRRIEKLNLAGSLAVVGTDSVETYRFDTIAAQAKQTGKAGVNCTITKLEKRGKDYLITIEQVGGQPKFRFETFQESLVESECRVVGPKGQVVRANEDSSVTRGDRTIRRYRLTLPVEAGLEGCRLELTTPQNIREVEVPFDLRGIILP